MKDWLEELSDEEEEKDRKQREEAVARLRKLLNEKLFTIPFPSIRDIMDIDDPPTIERPNSYRYAGVDFSTSVDPESAMHHASDVNRFIEQMKGAMKPRSEEEGSKGDKYHQGVYKAVNAARAYLLARVTDGEMEQLLEFIEEVYYDDREYRDQLEWGLLVGIGMVLEGMLE